ncbi:EAL domain-containing protein [Phreatobacter sp.]|uniref:putative bifunctional diguanylate cyclase/phosphodiesterase n=1 Tax=Phreatobacter sp. TaxID=1966341 RepID=UPI0022C5191A|nr:EAL domain-containing protein [Phreatobacter sp.]MCZ8316028.1 EAL domain-containing protein [Phreatobacter sp.]
MVSPAPSAETTERRIAADAVAAADLAGRVRAAQIHAVTRFAPLTMLANLINAGVVLWVVAGDAHIGLVGGWAIAVLLMVAATTLGWLRTRGRQPRSTASPRAIRNATIHAALLAMLWAAVPLLWFAELPIEDQLVIACLMTGMICAGGFALSTLAPAAHVYVGILTLGSVLGLLQTDNSFVGALVALIVAYSIIVVQSVSGYSRLFAERFVAEARLKDRGEIIELLLNDFEENASDWLFETDPDFVVTSHSPRFATAAGLAGQSLVGRRIADLLAPEGREGLARRVAIAEPFRDMEVRVETPNGPRWWSLTARPVLAEDGPPRAWRGVGSDVSERRLAGDKVAWMARTDLLTGLPNRTHFRDIAAAKLDRARGEGSGFAIGFLDLDHFKSINDTLGHPVGDALLTAVSHDLSQLAGPDVVFGRVGGDEFGMIVTRFADRQAVLALADQVIDAVSRSRAIDGARLTVGTSVGLAFGVAETIDDLIRNADLALYRAKDQGRGKSVVFDDAMHSEAEERRRLQEDLRTALAGDELRLVYQPIVDLGHGEVVAFEALMRWQHPERGLLSPGLFIPIAEESGLIDAIGGWALRQACRDAATWPRHLGVAVNLSPAQFGQAGVLAHVTRALAESHLAPNRLELEITEALFMARHGNNERFLNDLHALGVRLALDDFGTGFSALGYLTRFPIQKLKIDQSFVRGRSDDDSRHAVVEAIVGIAHSLGLVTTAEGVETAEDLTWVTALGCTQGQGYHFAQPMPAAAIPGFLARFEPAAPVASPAF